LLSESAYEAQLHRRPDWDSLVEPVYEAQLHRRPDWDSLVEPVYDAEDLDPTDTAVGVSVRAQAVTGQLLPHAADRGTPH
jgi:hypothetical protein